MLRNEVYTGTLLWRCGNREAVRVPNAHTALVNREDFDRVQQLLADRRPRVRHPRAVGSRYLLSSLVHCARCGATMIGATAKSGAYCYYKCDNHFKRGKDVCPTPMVSKDRIEGFVIDRLKKKVLTDENVSDLVRMVNEELMLLAGRRRERVEEAERQLEAVNQKLLRLYAALETGKLEIDDLAPRIKELRAEQNRLQKTRDEALAQLEDDQTREMDEAQVLEHVRDLKALLSKGTLLEQKAFIKSFVRRIEFQPGQIAIDYTVPMPVAKDRTSEREVLSIRRCGSPTTSWRGASPIPLSSGQQHWPGSSAGQPRRKPFPPSSGS